MNLRQRLDEIRTLAEKAAPGILYLRKRDRATVLALLEVVEQQHRALEGVIDWMEARAKEQSKGGHEAFDREMLRQHAETARAALSLLDKEES